MIYPLIPSKASIKLKTSLLLFFSLFICNSLVSQEKSIKISNNKTGKVIIIKEYKRIKVKTLDGDKICGKLKILDNETIILNNEKIKLSHIEKIKRNPLLVSIFTNGVFYYLGVGFFAGSIALYALTINSSSFFLLAPSAASIYGGIKSPNFLKGYTKAKDWNYEVINN